MNVSAKAGSHDRRGNDALVGAVRGYRLPSGDITCSSCRVWRVPPVRLDRFIRDFELVRDAAAPVSSGLKRTREDAFERADNRHRDGRDGSTTSPDRIVTGYRCRISLETTHSRTEGSDMEVKSPDLRSAISPVIPSA